MMLKALGWLTGDGALVLLIAGCLGAGAAVSYTATASYYKAKIARIESAQVDAAVGQRGGLVGVLRTRSLSRRFPSPPLLLGLAVASSPPHGGPEGPWVAVSWIRPSPTDGGFR